MFEFSYSFEEAYLRLKKGWLVQSEHMSPEEFYYYEGNKIKLSDHTEVKSVPTDFIEGKWARIVLGDWTWAVHCLNKGCKVRLISWPQNHYIFIDNEGIICDNYNEAALVKAKWFEEDQWMIYHV